MSLSGVLDAVQGKLSFLVNDDDVAEAANNCYAALCYNKDQSSSWSCSYNFSDVGHVIWAYINYFVTNPDKNAKYYYDEVRDRSDPYRKALVERIAMTINKSPEFTNQVLSYLYWNVRRGKVAKGILRPREVAKFQNPDYWYSGVIGGLFNITTAMFEYAEKVLKKYAYVISQTTQGVTDLLDTVGKTMTYLPYIIGIAAVGFVGFKVYTFKKQSEFLKLRK
jgi:hypothetical protein